jgi:phosphoribosylformylglycinamidine synthase
MKDALNAGLRPGFVGTTRGDRIEVQGVGSITLAALRRAHEGWFPRYMRADELPPTN